MAAQVVRLPPLPSIREVIKLYKLNALKQLSQNFLFDPRLTDKIVKNAGTIVHNEVCEVGPGPGAITRSILMKRPSKLILIEKDPRFTPCLEMLAAASPCPVELHIGDVMSFTMQNIFSEKNRKEWENGLPNIRILGNLPFNVSTPLIIKWLHAISERKSAWEYGRVPLTLTFQKEVAERIVAPEGHQQRCRLSVMCQNWCAVDHRFTIPGKAFLPKPDVDVGVVHFTPHVKPIIDLPFKLVEKVVGTVFRHRQKHIYRPAALLFPNKGLGPDKTQENLVEELFQRAKVKPTLRSFQLNVHEFAQLCMAFKMMCDDIPGLAKYDRNEHSIEKTYVAYKEEVVEDIDNEEAEDDEDEIDLTKL